VVTIERDAAVGCARLRDEATSGPDRPVTASSAQASFQPVTYIMPSTTTGVFSRRA
jgi:hypothetical protein